MAKRRVKPGDRVTYRGRRFSVSKGETFVVTLRGTGYVDLQSELDGRPLYVVATRDVELIK